MITQVYLKPHVYSPAYNPIVWSFSSPEATRAGFSYVVDVYVNAATGSTTPTYRLKQRPNEAGVAIVDVSQIVQPFVDLTLFSAEEGYPDEYRRSGEITPTVFLKVGEEYAPATGAAINIFNGFGITGAPAYPIYALEVDGAPISVLPGALLPEEGIYSMAATGGYGYYQPYLMGGTGTVGQDYGLFLKRAPNSQTLALRDHHTLSFINWNYAVSPDVAKPIQGMLVSAYNLAGGLIGTTFYENTIFLGGGPNVATNYTTAFWVRENTMLTFRCGPADLGFTDAVGSYTVTAYYKASATGATGPQNVASETVTFTIDENCQDLYPTVRLSWLNDLGGRDYYNFDMFYELTSTAVQESYSQTNLNYNDYYPVVTTGNQPSANSAPNWQRGGTKLFNKIVDRKIQIQSNWLTQEWVDYLGGVPESPSIWAYVGDDPTPYTAKITSVDYTYKNIKQTKLVQATFSLDLSKPQPRQNY